MIAISQNYLEIKLWHQCKALTIDLGVEQGFLTIKR